MTSNPADWTVPCQVQPADTRLERWRRWRDHRWRQTAKGWGLRIDGYDVTVFEKLGYDPGWWTYCITRAGSRATGGDFGPKFRSEDEAFDAAFEALEEVR